MKQNEIKIRELCKLYRGAKRGAAIVEKGIEAIKAKMESAETEREQKLYESALRNKQNEIENMKNIIMRFETCILVLPEEERSVIEQLYVKGKKWAEVTDRDGNLLPIKQSITIWKRAKRRMARYI